MKNFIFERLGTIFIIIALQSNVLLAAKIDTQKIKDLTKRMNFLKEAHDDYKGSLRDYDKCVQKSCFQEIEALKKTNEDLNKAGRDFELRNILMGAKETADENFKQCTAKYCDDIKKNLQKSGRNFTLKIFAVIVPLTLLGVGLTIGVPMAKESLRLKNLIKKYGLADTPRNRKLLASGNAIWLHEEESISESLRNAMAEAYWEHEPSKRELEAYTNMLIKQKISIEEDLR